MTLKKKAGYHSDLDFVGRILRDDESAWSDFVNNYTKNIFLRAKSWTKKSNYKPDIDKRSYPLEGSQNEIIYTDETIDAYLWILEQLKKNKLKAYKGIAPLEHYINSILADKRFMIECIRKLKGRIKIPKCLQHSSELYKKIFTLMTQDKHEGQIASILNMSFEKVSEIKNEIRDVLRKNGKEDMVIKPVLNDIDDEILTNNDKQIFNSIEDEIDIKKEINKATSELKSDERLLLKFYFSDKLSVKQILQSYIEIERSLLDKINPKNIDKKDFLNIIDSIIDKIKQKLQDKHREIKNIKNLNHILEILLNKYYVFD